MNYGQLRKRCEQLVNELEYRAHGSLGEWAELLIVDLATQVRDATLDSAVEEVNRCREDGETDLRSVRERIRGLKE